MKTIFDKETRDELIHRINSLNESSKALWGKMNIYQILTHNPMWQQLIQGKIKSKRVFIWRLFGKTALKNVLKDDSPLKKSTPTTPEVMAKGKNGDLESQRKKWINALKNMQTYTKMNLYIHFLEK